MSYDLFIRQKVKTQLACGFDPVDPLNPRLFDWQARIVRWALKQGRAALFEECGLGKTLQQIEWAVQVATFTLSLIHI